MNEQQSDDNIIKKQLREEIRKKDILIEEYKDRIKVSNKYIKIQCNETKKYIEQLEKQIENVKHFVESIYLSVKTKEDDDFLFE